MMTIIIIIIIIVIIIVIIIIIIITIIIIIIIIIITTTTLKTADEDKFSKKTLHKCGKRQTDRQLRVARQQWPGNMSYDEDTTL